ncbi:MAG: TIR domain-containing protein [Acidobacteria bacterium]|nr:TIR domain-containing protein [Acidobacteriota bacterium]
MAHDVFISYSTKDKAAADAACAALEAEGLRCWIAPRDITPGTDWGDAIVRAISASRVMVLIFSDHANRSQQIKREVNQAIDKELAIIPLRIENVLPSGSLEYYLDTTHWLDALTLPLEYHLSRLAETVELLLNRKQEQSADVRDSVSGRAGKSHAAPRRSRSRLWLGGAAVLALLALLAGAFAIREWGASKKGERPMTRAEIAQAYGKSVVRVNAAWRLTDSSGKPLYHVYVRNVADGGSPLVPNAGSYVPAFVTVNDRVEPLLSAVKGPADEPVGGRSVGTGFVVSTDGKVLTARRVAAPWTVAYQFPDRARSGILLAPDRKTAAGVAGAPMDWVPEKTGQQIVGGVRGVSDELSVVFPQTTARVRVQMYELAQSHDLALLHVSPAAAATPRVEIHDNNETVKAGASAVVLSHPASAAPRLVISESGDKQGAATEELPEPTVGVANLTQIPRGTSVDNAGTPRLQPLGDVYEIAVSAADAGSDGAPVFDERGGVIGVLEVSPQGNAATAFVIPIRFAHELF